MNILPFEFYKNPEVIPEIFFLSFSEQRWEVIQLALCVDVTHDCMNEPPDDTWTHSWMIANLACKQSDHPRCLSWSSHSNLLSFWFTWGTRSYEWGTQYDSISLVKVWKSCFRTLTFPDVHLSKQILFEISDSKKFVFIFCRNNILQTSKGKKNLCFILSITVLNLSAFTNESTLWFQLKVLFPFLSLRVFGLLSSSLLLFPRRFGRYVLRPSSGVCRTR